MKPGKSIDSKFIMTLLVTVMTATLLSTCLISNARALTSGMMVEDYDTYLNSEIPGTIAAGQVWTGKSVAGSGGNFADGENGQFGVTLMALGGSVASMTPLITDAGIEFTDVLKDDYKFISSETTLAFFLNGSKVQLDKDPVTNTFHTTGLSGEHIEFNPALNTVTYIIPASALKTVTADAAIPNDSAPSAVFNTLEYGVALNDTDAPATYITNTEMQRCTAEFTATETNPYYHRSVITDYINVPETEPLSQVTPGPGFGTKGDISTFNLIALLVPGPKIHVFYPPHIGIDPTSTVDHYRVWIKAGLYTFGSENIVIGSNPFDDFVIEVNGTDYTTTGTVGICPDPTAGIITFELGIDSDNDKYIIDAHPTEGTVHYYGTVAKTDYDEHSWSFTTEDGIVVVLSGGGLVLTTITGEWIPEISDEGVVSQIHQAYGAIKLAKAPALNPIQRASAAIPTGALTVSMSVSGDGASDREAFDITVTFTPGGPENWNVLGITPPAGASGGNGVYTLALSAFNGTVTFSNIPTGTIYSITEAITTVQADAGWSPGASTGMTGTIDADGESAVVANIYAARVAGVQEKVPEENETTETGTDETGVKGDTDVLPQTGGISASTLLGFLGLALVAIGGTAFAIFKKKFLS